MPRITLLIQDLIYHMNIVILYKKFAKTVDVLKRACLKCNINVSYIECMFIASNKNSYLGTFIANVTSNQGELWQPANIKQ